jgi:hypothetical protein
MLQIADEKWCSLFRGGGGYKEPLPLKHGTLLEIGGLNLRGSEYEQALAVEYGNMSLG